MEVGWSELLVIGVVALVIIGPKDLPEMFRTLGRFTAKLRSMAREFSRAMEDAARDSGVNDVADDLRKVVSPKSMGLDAVKSAADKFEKWDPLKTARGSTAATPVGGPVKPAAAVGLGSAAAGDAVAQPDPNAPEAPPVTTPPAPVAGPATADLALKRAEREAIAREAAERLRSASAAQVQSDAFEDAPATVIVPPVTTTPLDAAPAKAAVKAPAKRAKPAAKTAEEKPAKVTKAKAAKPAAEKTAAKPAAKTTAKAAAKAEEPAKSKPASRAKAAKPAVAEEEAAPKRRAPARKKAAAPVTASGDEAKDQA